jgi:hypothetical protein
MDYIRRYSAYALCDGKQYAYTYLYTSKQRRKQNVSSEDSDFLTMVATNARQINGRKTS